MRELLATAKQSAEKITDENIQRALLETIAVLDKKVAELLSDVEDGFVIAEDLQVQLAEIQTQIESTQRIINEIVLTDATDTHSKRNANAILNSLLEEGIGRLHSVLKEKKQSADKSPTKINNAHMDAVVATVPLSTSSPLASVKHSVAGRDINNTVNNIAPRRLTPEEIQINLKHWPLPKLSDHFVGRQNLLEQLTLGLKVKDKLQAKALVITTHGLGGVGKTQLALKYIEKYKQDYQFVLWFSAENEVILYQEYYHFAKLIDLPIDGQPPKNIIKQVQGWLQQNTGWLIVYDNAPDAEIVANYRPQLGGNILITSRKNDWDEEQSIPIDIFSCEEAKKYIVVVTKFDLELNKADIQQLAETLGRLPLALAQACAYIKTKRKFDKQFTIQDYLKLYAESRAEMLADKTMPAEERHEPVAVTWQITFKTIKEQFPSALSLLESCAYLHADNIPNFLLKDLFRRQIEEAKEKLYIDNLDWLQRYNLLKITDNTEVDKRYSIHRLVQEVIRDSHQSQKSKDLTLSLISIFNENYSENPAKLEEFQKNKSLVTHGESIVTYYLKENGNQLNEDVFIILNNLANLYCRFASSSRLNKAIEYFSLLLNFLESKRDNDLSKKARLLNGLGDAHFNMGWQLNNIDMLSKAEAFYVQILNLFEVDPSESIKALNGIIKSNCQLSKLLEDQDKKEEKIQLAISYEKQIEALEPKIERNAYAKALNAVGNAYLFLYRLNKQKDNVKSAKSFWQKALHIYKSQENPEQSIVLNNIGQLYVELGGKSKFLKAEKYFMDALKFIEKALGEHHEEYALTAYNLGEIYVLLIGEVSESEKCEMATQGKKYLELARQIFVEKFGDNQSDIEAIDEWLEECNKYAKVAVPKLDEAQLPTMNPNAYEIQKAKTISSTSTFFQSPSSTVEEWQRQIQANYAVTQQAKADQENVAPKQLGK